MPELARTVRVSVELSRGEGRIQGFVHDPVWGRQPYDGWLQLAAVLDRARSASDAPGQAGRPAQVLAIDGGGMRGLIPALILAELELRTGRGCAALFDLFAGTGTGGIVALALTTLRLDSGTPWRAVDLVDFFERHGPTIFPPRPPDPPPAAAPGTPGPLNSALTTFFTEQTIASAVKPVIVTTFDLSCHEPLILSSRRAAEDLSWDLPVCLAACATSATPTMFVPLGIRLGHDAQDRLLADGALYANNPAMCAYSEAQQAFPDAPVRLLSLGTGHAAPAAAWHDVHEWSPAQWARPLFAIAVDGASRDVHAHLGSALDPGSYWRLQLPLTNASPHFDDASATNLAYLHEHGQRVIKHFDRELDAVSCVLTA